MSPERFVKGESERTVFICPSMRPRFFLVKPAKLLSNCIMVSLNAKLFRCCLYELGLSRCMVRFFLKGVYADGND